METESPLPILALSLPDELKKREMAEVGEPEAAEEEKNKHDSPSTLHRPSLHLMEEHCEEIFDPEHENSSSGNAPTSIENIISSIGNDSIISLQDLEVVANTSFPPSELSAAVRQLGTNYNKLVRKFQEKTCEFETLTKKCNEDCIPKYEALREQYISEYSEKERICTELEEAKRNLQDCAAKYEKLLKRYMEEYAERKRLYNEVIELKGNIRVFCRCRPLSTEESSNGYTNVFEFDASHETDLQIVSSDSSKKHFKFDHVFPPQASQEAVFAETLPVVTSVLDGFNACIFAYGQTGTGKTFTMEGTEENRGVNYRTLEELFRVSSERNSTMKYEFSVSILEVYNEKIRDLLVSNLNQQGKKLEIKQTADGTHEVPGLVEAQAYDTNSVWELLRVGTQNRSVGSTLANELSSRSHCLLRITIKAENLLNGQRNRSHLWLVDLAGSERVGKIEAEGERLKESQFINKSLSALGDVISALSSKNPHIPYRNSKLTHLLQSSLGGDCKALMFVQISPCSADLGETLCSLNFATRVRGIEQGPARKQADPSESLKFKQMAEKLRQEEKENAVLSDRLQLMHLKYASRENVCKNLQDRIKDLENQLADEKRRNQQETRDATVKGRRPPLAPIKERPPFRKSNNLQLPSGYRRSFASSSSSTSGYDKENFTETTKKKAPLRASRMTLAPAPVGRPMGGKPVRRVSIAAIPSHASEAFDGFQRNHHQQQQNYNYPCRASSMVPRRRSVASFAPAAVAASTPDCSKYSTPQSSSHQAILAWKSKIPSFISPRQRLRLLPSPAGAGGLVNNNNNVHTPKAGAKKICFSVQKRLIVSPAQIPRPAMMHSFSNADSGSDILEKFGGARRILCKTAKNRRVSVI